MGKSGKCFDPLLEEDCEMVDDKANFVVMVEDRSEDDCTMQNVHK